MKTLNLLGVFRFVECLNGIILINGCGEGLDFN